MFTKQMHLPLYHLPNPVSFFFTTEKTLLRVCWWVRGKVCNLTIETVQSLEYTLRTGGQSLGLFPLWLHPFTSLPTVYEGPFSPALVFSIVAILAVVRWNLSVILVYLPTLPPRQSRVMNIFSSLLAVCTLCLRDCLSILFAHFLTGSFVWGELDFSHIL